MRENINPKNAWHGRPWRIAAWLTAAGLISVPIGVQMIHGPFGWSLSDFIFAAFILSAGCFLFDWAARSAPSLTYLAGAGAGLVAGFGLLVVNGAVGLVGAEDEPHNLLLGVVLLVAICGSVVAQVKPPIMAKAMMAAALTHIVISVALLVRAGGMSDGDARMEVVGLSVFAGMWLASAWLFRSAAPLSNVHNSDTIPSL